MPAVEMFIAKFGKVVLIDVDHPLAIAQRDADALALENASNQLDKGAGGLIDLDALKAMGAPDPVTPLTSGFVQVVAEPAPGPVLELVPTTAVIDDDTLRKLADLREPVTITPIPGASVTVEVPNGDTPALAGFMDATKAPGAEGGPVDLVEDHPAPSAEG